MKTIVHRSKIFTVTLRAVAMLALPCVAAAAGPQSPKAGIEEKKAPQGQTTDERLQQQEERIGELEKRLQE